MRRWPLVLFLIAGVGLGAWFVTRFAGRNQERPRVSTEEPGPGATTRDPHDLLDPVERDWLERAGLKDPAAALR